jgi:hypothetical protein
LGVLTMHRNGAHDGPESVLTFARNHCSRSTEMGAHDAPEYAFSGPRYCGGIISKTKLITIRELSDLFQVREEFPTRRHVRRSLIGR